MRCYLLTYLQEDGERNSGRTLGGVADDGVDELVDVHERDGDVVRLARDAVDDSLAHRADQHVTRHVTRRREQTTVVHRVHCTATQATARGSFVH